jgi:hypothetical protein
MYRQRLLCAILLIVGQIVSGSAYSGSAPTLNDHYPDSYIVKKGDTLWDISSIFLEDPWLWPKIWQSNPAILNPHWIYPGDHIQIHSGKDNAPYLTLRRASQTGASSEHGIDSNTHPLPMRVLTSLLAKPLLIESSEYSKAPQIVGSRDQRLMYSQGDTVYVVGSEVLPKPQAYAIYRAGEPLYDPITQESLGVQAHHVGEGIMTHSQQLARLRITQSLSEILPGDRLLSIENIAPTDTWRGVGADIGLTAQVIALPDALSQVGSYQVIVINAGHQQALSEGHLVSIQRTEKIVAPQQEKNPTLTAPAGSILEPLGTAVVYRVFDKVSYCFILSAERPIRIGDGIGDLMDARHTSWGHDSAHSI